MKIVIPTQCPVCASSLVLKNDQLFCVNAACPAQLTAKVIHFAKVLGIKGFGPKTVEKLELADITEIYLLKIDELTEALGSEKVAAKLLSEIEASKDAKLDKILAAFSIPLVGSTAATKLCSVIESVDDITAEMCKKAGLGDKATANLISWLETEFSEIREFLPFDFQTSGTASNTDRGKSICITGKLTSFKTKAEAHAVLLGLGFTVADSVTKTLTYLVDEGDKASAKRKKAEDFGIPIIENLEDFLKENK
jgi:NAD-dependent DNA ligase